MKKIISLFLTTMLVLSMCSVSALAAEVYTPVTVSGGVYAPNTMVEDMTFSTANDKLTPVVEGTSTVFTPSLTTDSNQQGANHYTNGSWDASPASHKNYDYAEVTFDVTFNGTISGTNYLYFGLEMSTLKNTSREYSGAFSAVSNASRYHSGSTVNTHNIKYTIAYGDGTTTIKTYVDGELKTTSDKNYAPADGTTRYITLIPYGKMNYGSDGALNADTKDITVTISNLDVKEYYVDALIQEFSGEYTLNDDVSINYNVPDSAEKATLMVAGKKAATVTSGAYVTTVDLSEFIGFWGKVPVELYIDGVLAKSSYFVVSDTPEVIDLGTESFEGTNYTSSDTIRYNSGAIDINDIVKTDIAGNTTGKLIIKRANQDYAQEAVRRMLISSVYDDIKTSVFEIEFDVYVTNTDFYFGIFSESYYSSDANTVPKNQWANSTLNEQGYLDGWGWFKKMNTTGYATLNAWKRMKISLDMSAGKASLYDGNGNMLESINYKPYGVGYLGLGFKTDTSTSTGECYLDNVTFSTYEPSTSASVESVSVDSNNNINIAFDKAFADSVNTNAVTFSLGNANVSFNNDRTGITIVPNGTITAADALVTISKSALGSGTDMVIPVSFKEFMNANLNYDVSTRTYTGTVDLKTQKTGDLGKIYLAVYDGDALYDVITEDIIVTSPDDTYTCPYTMPEDTSYTVKMFVWDANLTPYVDVVD